MAANKSESENLFVAFGKQVVSVHEAIKKAPSRKNQILTVFISNFYEAVKETVKSHGTIAPHYFFVSETPNFGTPPITDEVIRKAKEMNAAAVLYVEGFHSKMDISDIIYHVSMSAPSLGVMGWVFKVKIHDGEVEIIREMPYLFDSHDKIKTLGEMIEEMG